MRVFLVGLPGAGKSTLGKALAAALDLPFTDQDELLRLQYGLTARRMLETLGEAAFRLREAAELLKWISRNDSGVMATGGGSPAHFAGMSVMRAVGFVVWLDLSCEAWLKRIASLRDRPLLWQDDGKLDLAFANCLYEARRPGYSLAQIRVNADSLPEPLELAKTLRRSAEQMQRVADEMQYQTNQSAHQGAIDSDILEVFANLKF